MPLRFTHQEGAATIVWEILPNEEARYRREWNQRAQSGQTHGSYRFHPLLVDDMPYKDNARHEEFEVRFGASPEEPFDTA